MLYSQVKSEFDSNSIKKISMWDKISAQTPYSSLKCMIRWKYLTQRYNQVLENMGPNRTGGKRITFEYFDEMDEVLQNSYSITRCG